MSMSQTNLESRPQSIVAFDYGTKRIGVAVGQTVSGTASPVATVRSRAGNPDWNAIRAIIESFAPEALVVGIPIEVNEGEDTIEHPMTRPVMRFADQLHGLFGLPVHIVDERLSTYEARSRAPGDGQIRCGRRPGHPGDLAARFRPAGRPSSGLAPPSSLGPMSRPEEMQSPLYGHAEVLGFIDGMAERLAPLLYPDTALIGIHTGGVWVAERLRERLAIEPPIGELDIAFYRDDFSQIGMHPSVRPSKLPFEVDGRHIALIDDILYTGRTVRAALNEVFDYGRPASVLLAVLVDRGGRQLPIQPDAAGTTLALGHDEHVKLTGPDPLVLRLHRVAQAPSG